MSCLPCVLGTSTAPNRYCRVACPPIRDLHRQQCRQFQVLDSISFRGQGPVPSAYCGSIIVLCCPSGLAWSWSLLINCFATSDCRLLLRVVETGASPLQHTEHSVRSQPLINAHSSYQGVYSAGTTKGSSGFKKFLDQLIFQARGSQF